MPLFSKTLPLRWTPDWKITALGLCFLPLLVSLGYWQLDRAEEKRQLQQLFDERKQSGAKPIETLENDHDLRYQPVSLIGRYVPGREILLDNKMVNGRFGYEALSLFKIQGQEMYVWINRGWVAGDPTRQTLPIIHYPSNSIVSLEGEVYVPQGSLLLLGGEQEKVWPRRLPQINIDELIDELGLPFFPYTIRLGERQSGVFERHWFVVNIQPEKHIAYAFQWFAMALTVIIILLLGNTNLWSLLRSGK